MFTRCTNKEYFLLIIRIYFSYLRSVYEAVCWNSCKKFHIGILKRFIHVWEYMYNISFLFLWVSSSHTLFACKKKKKKIIFPEAYVTKNLFFLILPNIKHKKCFLKCWQRFNCTTKQQLHSFQLTACFLGWHLCLIFNTWMKKRYKLSCADHTHAHACHHAHAHSFQKFTCVVRLACMLLCLK